MKELVIHINFDAKIIVVYLATGSATMIMTVEIILMRNHAVR